MQVYFEKRTLKMVEKVKKTSERATSSLPRNAALKQIIFKDSD